MRDASPHVTIGVCTFQRPRQLADTLRSLFSLDWPAGIRGAIVVADNDGAPSARDLVESLARSAPVDLRYVHAPAQNISLARNAVLKAASRDSRFIAFIDDDEIAPPHWIAALWARLVETGADVVLGPVRGIYGAGAPSWMRRGRFHDTLPTFSRGAIRTGYTCNALLRLDGPALAGRRFDPTLGRTGGEDTLFFASAHAAGATIVFAPDAAVDEAVPPERATLGWLVRRRYRMGHTHARLLTDLRPPAPRRASALALSKAAVCATLAFVQLPFAVARNRSILRGALHLGTFAYLAGAPPVRIYGIQTSGPEDFDGGGESSTSALRRRS